ncbi:SusC/RagA family TonB-linked outer membrane protein [uncultured Algibacter sp.]|uniref:SusC/RagA family TonB-linked outer membrane protein n=1 Tax=uncultured Algibacter sp. TaxID=298659 RepID=UPI00321783DF
MKYNLKETILFRDKRLIKIIMKSCFLLFCSLAFSFNTSTGFSQNTKIVIDSDKSITVEDVFKLIKSQTDYSFIYDVEMVKDAQLINVKKGIVKIASLLQKALDPISCTYKFKNDTFIVKNKKRHIKNDFQQKTFIITGQVLDESGLPIAGANVVVTTPQLGEQTFKNPNFIIRGTATDFDGSFTLEVSLNLELSVFLIGFKDYSILITNSKQKEYPIILKEDISQLDEVVLTGYTKTDIKRSSVAASKITKKDIARQKAINLSDRLEGLSPGLNINSVTNPGGQKQNELIIRGKSTFDLNFDFGSENSGQRQQQNSLNRQPLIVVDGFPYEGPLDDIDPQTIETIDVLRDAAATTLWGIRASNGVLVVTTKRGSEFSGKPTITLTSNLTIGMGQDLSGLGLASAEETINLYSNYYQLDTGFDNVAINVFNDPNDPFNIADRYALLDPFQQIWADFYNPNNGISEQERDARLSALAQNNILKDFDRYLLSPGFIQENTLAMRGGNPLSSYNFTVTHVNEKKPDIGDEFRRLNLSLTTDIKLSEKIKLIVDGSLTNSVSRDNGIGVSSLLNAEGLRIYDRLANNDGVPQAVRNIYSEFRNEFSTLGFEDPSYNPILDQKLRDNENKRFNLRLATGLNYKVTKWLTADLKYQYNRIVTDINNNKDVRLFNTRSNNNNYITNVINGANSQVVRDVPYGGTLENSLELTLNSVLRGSLQFNNKFGAHHDVSALAGMEVSQNTINLNRRTYFGYNERTGISNANFDPTSIEGYQLGSIPSYIQITTPIAINNIFRPDVESRAISTFGNLAYSYKSKYNLTLSGKIDQTTAFGINERLSKPLLWAVGGSWNLAEEGFLGNWANSLKLRGSYGVNGNLRRGLSTAVVIGYGVNELISDDNFARISSSGNPNLTFEETTTKNIGLDFGFFNNSINGSVDVYERTSENLLVPFNINETFGQTGDVFRNDGSIENRGVEINLNLDILRDSEFTWSSNFNLSYNKNKVLSISENNLPRSFFLITEVNNGRQNIIGKDISSRYRYEWAGLDRDGNPQIFNENGDIIGYENGFPSTAALVTTKPFIAPAFGGFRNTFGYKDWTLSFLASFKFGHVFQESLNQKYASSADKIYHKDVANRWRQAGDQLFTDIPALPRNFDELNFIRKDFFTLSDYGIQDASFVRLRDITLGYTLENYTTEKIGIQAINFTLQARNLGLLWKANNVGLDPESIPFTISNGSLTDNFNGAFRPGVIPPVTIVFGVNIKL